MTAIKASAQIIEGHIDRLRVAVPTARGNIHIRIDGVPIVGTIENAADIRILRSLHQQGAPVRVGVLTGARLRRSFSWLIAHRGLDIPPRYYADEWRSAWRQVAIWLTVTAVAVPIAWLIGLDTFWQVLVMIMSVVAAMIGLLFAGFSLYGLWINRRHRSAILESESLYRQYQGKSLRATPQRNFPMPVSDIDEIIAFPEENQPPIMWIRGKLTSLTHEARRPAKNASFGIYRFFIGGQPYVMIVSEDFGDAMPFLAEGDQVEIAAYADEIPGSQSRRVVYAMHNLEDDRVYVCHRLSRRGGSKIPPLALGMRRRASILIRGGGLMLSAWLLVIGIMYFAGTPSTPEELPTFAMLMAGVFLACWFGIALPLLFLEVRWRLGRPTQRQRTLERVYLALDLGTPFAPTAHIEEL